MFEANPNSYVLAKQLHSGNPEAYEFVVCSFAELIIRRLRKYGFRRNEAIDICSDCLLKLWETRCKGYRPEKGPFTRWLLTVALNLALERLKSNREVRLVALAEAERLE